MTELNKRHCPKGPRGPISPFLCDYCQHGKPLIEIGKPSDEDYLKVWIDKQGRNPLKEVATPLSILSILGKIVGCIPW